MNPSAPFVHIGTAIPNPKEVESVPLWEQQVKIITLLSFKPMHELIRQPMKKEGNDFMGLSLAAFQLAITIQLGRKKASKWIIYSY